MKKINLIGLAVVLISSLVFLSNAYADKPVNTLIVPTQYPTIYDAINAANPGDTVLVLPGQYVINVPIVVDKDLTIKSEQGPENTTLLVQFIMSYNSGVFVIITGTTSATTIEGFTINILPTMYPGFMGAILCQPGASPTIIDNVMHGPGSNSGGSAIYAYSNNSLLVKNNVMSTFSSGVTLCNASSAEIVNCIMHHNGFGVWVASSSSAEIVNCAVVYNTAAGLAIVSGTPEETSLKNSIVYGNTAAFCSEYGGVPPGSVTYSDIGGTSVYPGLGNINADPLFINPALYDYHLRPRSPGIDAGDPNLVYDDPEDPHNPGMALYPAQGSVINDMGAYGGPGIILE